MTIAKGMRPSKKAQITAHRERKSGGCFGLDQTLEVCSKGDASSGSQGKTIKIQVVKQPLAFFLKYIPLNAPYKEYKYEALRTNFHLAHIY